MTHRKSDWRLVIGTLCVLGIAGSSARAQQAGGPGPSRAAYTQVGKSCAADLERICPNLTVPGTGGRDQAICLKPYRTSLSLGCRGAVRAVTH